MRKMKGKVWKFGNNIDTDQIIEAKRVNETNPEKYLMGQTDNKRFLEYYQKQENSIKGHIFIAGENFGCGSSRENALTLMKKVGIAAIVAKSFARIYYRNGVAVGFPLVECDYVDEISQGDIIEIDLNNRKIYNRTKLQEYEIHNIPSFIRQILDAGGIIPYRMKILKGE